MLALPLTCNLPQRRYFGDQGRRQLIFLGPISHERFIAWQPGRGTKPPFLLWLLKIRFVRRSSFAVPLLIRDRLAFKGMVANFPSMRLAGEIDGEPFEGDFLLLEALNMRSVGPGLGLAPDADPTDGLLDFSFIAAERREDFASFIDTYAENSTPPAPGRLLRGRRLRLKGHSYEGSY
jgi:hypothetical protein